MLVKDESNQIMLLKLRALSLPQNRRLSKQFQQDHGFYIFSVFKNFDLLREIRLPELLHIFTDLAHLVPRTYSTSSLKQYGDGMVVKVVVSEMHNSLGLCSAYLSNLSVEYMVQVAIT